MKARSLTDGEVALARSVFGDAIDYRTVTLVRRKWAFFQPADVVMAPRGHIHFHPRGNAWCDDFASARGPSRSRDGLTRLSHC